MQVEFDDIAGGKGLLRQGGEKEFVHDALACDANGTLLFVGWVGGYPHPAEYAFGSHRYLWAVVEPALRLAFWTLLDLIWGQMQTSVDLRMIKDAVLFATRHKREASQLREDCSRAVLAVEPQQAMLRQELLRCEVARDGGKRLSQFLSVAPVAFVAKGAEPTFSGEPG